MRPSSWFVAACALILVGADGPEDPAKKELAKFQGSWTVESIQIGSKKTPKESLKAFNLVVEGDKWTANRKTMKFKLDPSRTPRQLDLFDEINGEERIIRCLYEFKDDTLIVCRPYMTKTTERPTEIKPDGAFVGVTVFKREKK